MAVRTAPCTLAALAEHGHLSSRGAVLQIGFLGPAFFLTQLSHVKTPLAAVACMMASQGLDAFSQSGLYSNHQVRTVERVLCPYPFSR